MATSEIDAVNAAVTEIRLPIQFKTNQWLLMIKPPTREISEKDKKILNEGVCSIKLETIKDSPNIHYYYYKHDKNYVIIQITKKSDDTFVYCYKYN